MDGIKGGNVTRTQELLADGHTRSMGGDENDITGPGRLDITELDGSAMQKPEGRVQPEMIFDLVTVDSTMEMVGEGKADDVGSLGDVGYGEDGRESVLSCGSAGFGAGRQTDSDRVAGVTQVQSEGAALRAVAQNSNLLFGFIFGRHWRNIGAYVNTAKCSSSMDPLLESIRRLVKEALAEDVGRGDLTSIACLEPNPVKAKLVAKSPGVLSGLMPALLVFDTVDSANKIFTHYRDGDHFSAGDVILQIDGFNQTVLASERVALNFLAHLSGIATLTSKFVELTAGTDARILDTRKTTPGWRQLEKMAVRHGGGHNHRFGLFDMVLIKDNHIASAGSIRGAVDMAREFLQSRDFRVQFQTEAEKILIEVEVISEAQLREAIEARADRLLLDNQTVESLKLLVRLARKIDPSVQLEASGNVSLDTVAAIAATGVDYVSVGAITHSAPVVDFSLQVTA